MSFWERMDELAAKPRTPPRTDPRTRSNVRYTALLAKRQRIRDRYEADRDAVEAELAAERARLRALGVEVEPPTP